MTDNGHITWTNERRKLGELIPWPRNPRQINKKQAERLADSFKRFAQVETFAIGPENELYNGHQRLSTWAEKYGPDLEIDVRVSSRPLTESEREQLTTYLHQGAIGAWDPVKLEREFRIDDLLNWGFDVESLKALSISIPGLDDRYSRKIESPLYTPKGPKPNVADLFDDTRTKQLLSEIDASDLPEDEKVFLRVAACRHTIFHYKRIAEYYAHSGEDIQALMENSALVIIDFDRAIELGYVRLSEEIAGLYRDDYSGAEYSGEEGEP